MLYTRLENAQVNGKRVIVRIDVNGCIEENLGSVIYPVYLLAILPTLEFLLERGAFILICTHAVHSKTKTPIKLDRLAHEISKLLSLPVKYGSKFLEEKAKDKLEISDRITFLENLAIYPQESEGDENFAKRMASLGDFYVNEARSGNSQNYSSISKLPKYLPAYPGYVLYREIDFFRSLLDIKQKKICLVLGGVGLEKKLDLIKTILNRIDSLLICGGLSYTFLYSRAISVGASLCEDYLGVPAFQLMEKAELSKINMLFPIDHILSREILMKHSVKRSNQISDGWTGVDVGPKTLSKFQKTLKGASTILWYGPLGCSEVQKFRSGSLNFAKYLAKSKASTCVIGSETTSIALSIGEKKINAYNYIEPDSQFFLDILSESSMPGLSVLQNKEYL